MNSEQIITVNAHLSVLVVERKGKMTHQLPLDTENTKIVTEMFDKVFSCRIKEEETVFIRTTGDSHRYKITMSKGKGNNTKVYDLDPDKELDVCLYEFVVFPNGEIRCRLKVKS